MCCTWYASKFGKLSIDHRTGKGQFSFQSQRRAMSKNVQTASQLHSSIPLVLPWSRAQVSLEVEYQSILVEGARDRVSAISLLGTRAAAFAFQCVQLFPGIIWEMPFWCLWQWMTAMYFGFELLLWNLKSQPHTLYRNFLYLNVLFFPNSSTSM